MEKKRTTPEYITELKPGEIFVFGSNLQGMHGGGAARTAYQKFGAIMGQGVGLQGQSYGIPTMQGATRNSRIEFLSIWRKNLIPNPLPSDAPSMIPGISAMMNDLKS